MNETRPSVLDSLRAELSPAAAPAPVPVPVPETSAGTMLRQMREAAGVDAGLLASAMKVSLGKLDALEHDRLDQLPDVTFARALAAAICRAFGVDPAPVLARMPTSASGLHAPATNINAPFHTGGGSGASRLAGTFSRPLLLVVAALLLGAALLWLWPTWPIRLTTPDAAVQPADAPSEAIEPVVVPEPVPAELPPAEAATTEGAAPSPAPPVAAAASAPVAPAAASQLALSASGESWVTVHDAAGKSLINRALQAGESVALSGELPLSVTVGRKDVVQATVHGQPFDLRGLGSSSVARFQVK